MVPIVTAGGTKTIVIQQQAPPAAMSDTVQPKPVAKPENNVKPAPAGAESHILPNVQVVDPSAKQVPMQPVAENSDPSPPTAEKHPQSAEQSSVENPLPTTPASEPISDVMPSPLPSPPLPVRVPHPDPLPVQPQIQAAVKEISLGDSDGSVSQEILQNLSDDDSNDALPDGAEVTKNEVDDNESGTQQAPNQMEEEIVLNSDEEPLLGED